MAYLSDLDAYCIKSFSTKSLTECQTQIDTVLKEMAFRRLMSDLPKVSICMTVLQHLRYRVTILTNDVSANALQFISNYKIFYSHCLSPKSQASSSKKQRVQPSCGSSSSQLLPSQRLDYQCSSPSLRDQKFDDMCVANSSRYEHSPDDCVVMTTSERTTTEDVEQKECQIDSTIHINSSTRIIQARGGVSSGNDFNQDQGDLIIDQIDSATSSRRFPDYDEYIHKCSCVSLNIPSMFHVDCVDLTTLLQPYEPLYYRNYYGERIEVLDPQKLIGSKRSHRTFSIDEIYSIGSIRVTAESSNSTYYLVDWRELLSWASSGGRSSTNS